MAKGDAVPEEHHVTRWIKPRFLGKNDDGTVDVDEFGCPQTIFPSAFELRDDEDALSITWLEHFGATLADQLPLAAEAVRSATASGDLKPKSAFAVGNVGQIRTAAQDHGFKVRIIEDPEDNNTGHCEVRRYPRDADEFYQAMALDVFRRRYLYGDIVKPGWGPALAH